MNKFIRNNKGVLTPILIFIVSLIGLIYLGLIILKQQKIYVNKEYLQVLADGKAMKLNLFFESQKEKQKILASMSVFKEVILHPDDPAKIENAKERINELKDVLSRIAIFTGGGVMFIAESGPVPMDYSALPYFASKDKEAIFMRYYDEYQKRDYYSILGPIYDSLEKDKVIGSVAFNIDLENINALIKEGLDDGEGKEIYLVEENGLLLTDSKYVGNNNKHGILIQEVKSEGAKICLGCLEEHYKDGIAEKPEDEIIRYKNYIGNEVYGAHAHVAAIGGCVIAEENKDEITKFSLIDSFKNLFKKEVKNGKML